MLVSITIIIDDCDYVIIPWGPAESLFQQGYYELMKKALKPDGILCCQGTQLSLTFLFLTDHLTKGSYACLVYALAFSHWWVDWAS